VKEVMKLGPLDYFGERALLNDAPRSATVTAATGMTLLSVSKAIFEEVLGPLDRLIDSHRKLREERAQVAYLLQRQALALSLTLTLILTLTRTLTLARQPTCGGRRRACST
jgi:CRP-like cAMP-binding protein